MCDQHSAYADIKNYLDLGWCYPPQLCFFLQYDWLLSSEWYCTIHLRAKTKWFRKRLLNPNK
jgi:hypothetical protein